LLTEISNHFANGEKLLSKTEEMLGTDDPIVNKLKTAMSVMIWKKASCSRFHPLDITSRNIILLLFSI
jgi:hypothetical protein